MKSNTPKGKNKIMREIRRINKSKMRVKKGLLPLTFTDDGWRVILPKSLEFYDFLPSGRKLLSMSVYDLDGKGEYYWIPYSEPPKGVTTPAMRLALMGEE